MFVLMAFAGCHRGPATYEFTQNPHQIVANAEKFVSQVERNSKHYSAEEWDVAINQFIQMSKNQFELSGVMNEREQMEFDNVRMRFMAAIDANGTEEMVMRLKEMYSAMRGE